MDYSLLLGIFKRETDESKKSFGYSMKLKKSEEGNSIELEELKEIKEYPLFGGLRKASHLEF